MHIIYWNHFFSKCGSPSIFSKSSSVSDSEPAAVPSASCNWEMPRWVSVGTSFVSYLQILPRQIVYAILRFQLWQGFHHIGNIHLPDHLGRFRILVLWLKGSYAHCSYEPVIGWLLIIFCSCIQTFQRQFRYYYGKSRNISVGPLLIQLGHKGF